MPNYNEKESRFLSAYWGTQLDAELEKKIALRSEMYESFRIPDYIFGGEKTYRPTVGKKEDLPKERVYSIDEIESGIDSIVSSLLPNRRYNSSIRLLEAYLATDSLPNDLRIEIVELLVEVRSQVNSGGDKGLLY